MARSPRWLPRAVLIASCGLAIACRAIVGFDSYAPQSNTSDAATSSDASSLRDALDLDAGNSDVAVADSAPSSESAHEAFDQDGIYHPPSGCVRIHAKLWGAGGGSGVAEAGGAGGYAEGSWVLQNDAVRVQVGTSGKDDAGGAPGGGAPGITNPNDDARGGGGFSEVSNGSAALLAGGGGGACASGQGGAGGGALAENGGGVGGGGGAATNADGPGGMATSSASGNSGTSYQGGRGCPTSQPYRAGGGGGGGFHGGGGGATGFNDPTCGGGGGGSGFYSNEVTGRLEAGKGTIPGNVGDAERKTAGEPGSAGRVILWCSSP